MPTLETYCPACEAVAEVRGKTRSLPAPIGWYRCPECYAGTLGHLLPVRKKLGLLQGMIPRFPVVRSLGSVVGNTADGNTLSLGTVSAQVGDQLIAQIIQKHPNASWNQTGDIAVSWGSASIAVQDISFAYGMAGGGVDLCRCLQHTVLANQAAAMTFTFIPTLAQDRVITMVLIRGLNASPIAFDDVEEQAGYPYALPVNFVTDVDFHVICHGQSVGSDGLGAVWDAPLSLKVQKDDASIVNSILTTTAPVSSPITYTALSGGGIGHGTGFFGFKIQ